MQVFNESVNTIHHEGTRNSLVVTSKHELFFGVFNVKVNDNFYVVEQVGEYDECPVVKIPVTIDGNVEERLFDLVVGRESKIIFNESISNFDMLQEAENIQEESLDIFNKPSPVITDAVELSQEEIDELIHGDSKTIKESFEVESPIKYGRYPVEIEKIATDLQETVGKLQKNARKVIQEYTNKQLKKLKSLNENDNGSADALLKSAKADLVEEFVKITTEIKSELTNSNVDSRKDINTTLDRKLATAINEFDEKINRQFDQYTKVYNDTISKYIDVVLKDQYKPKVQSFIDTTKTELVETFQKLSEEVASQVNEKVGVKDWNELNQIFSNNSQMLIQANIELNNKIQNVASQIVAEHVIDQKISESISGIETHFSNNIQSINEKINTLDDATREHLLGIIAESRNLLLQEIATIKQNAAVEYVIESKTKQEKLDITTLKSDLLKDLDSKISNAIVNLKKFTTYYGGGGGTVAQQFADGGTMNGNLTVVGAISASQYLGIDIPRGDYLPLSGGTVTGNVTINGAVSAGNLSASDIYSNGNRVATVVDPVRTTLTGNGTLSTFPISGASGLVNPSALIVAIDGILQEPSVDYTLSASRITFTSPLPNGSKAVVISPTNTLQVSNMIPADGSVTSNKIAVGVNLRDPIIINTLNGSSSIVNFLNTPNSANLAAVVTDKVGDGPLMFRDELKNQCGLLHTRVVLTSSVSAAFGQNIRPFGTRTLDANKRYKFEVYLPITAANSGRASQTMEGVSTAPVVFKSYQSTHNITAEMAGSSLTNLGSFGGQTTTGTNVSKITGIIGTGTTTATFYHQFTCDQGSLSAGSSATVRAGAYFEIYEIN